ncbi:MAG: insulinase family protein [Lentimicrobiaceae bacterium]|nr:insulinase family protein [Lentimicrobiaceae bacterium]
MSYNYHTLPNGIRIIHKQVPAIITHIGLVVNTGTRDEKENESGIAHFIEHIIFKGTEKRNTYQVLSYLENVGGDLNAYTTKEETFFHASVLNAYLPRAVELLADIVFNSTFYEKIIETEKDVVREEIKLYKDTPSELVFDEFENLVFANHSLGTNILGTLQSVKNISRNKILSFIERTYNTNQMVIAVVGNVDFQRCVRGISRHFADRTANAREFQRQPFLSNRTQHKSIKSRVSQAHAVMGCVLPNYDERKNLVATLLNNVLGGYGLNSRLNMAIREKKGYVYNIESNYAALSDVGLFTLYIGSDFKKLDKCIELVHKELKKMREQKLGSLQLHRAHLQLIGQTCLFYESNLNEMLSIGRTHLVFNEVEDISSVIQKIETISSSELLDIANEMLCADNMSSLFMVK